MPISIKAKQVASVMLIVGLSVMAVSAWYFTELGHVRLEETYARAELVSKTVRQRVFDVVQEGGTSLDAIKDDKGLKSILTSGDAYAANILYTVIVDRADVVVQGDEARLGQVLPRAADLNGLMEATRWEQVKVLSTRGGRSYEIRAPLVIGTVEIGEVRVGVSTLLLRSQLEEALLVPLWAAVGALAVGLLVSVLLANLTLRPIHILRSGLARLGRGDLEVHVDLPPGSELADLGDSFRAVSARLAADRTALAGQRATLESVVENLEDAVALFGPNGVLLFANPAMRPALTGDQGTIAELFPKDHPYRAAVEDVLAHRATRPPETVQVPGGGERLVLTHPVEDAQGQPLGVLLVARNLAFLTHVESTLSYSRKLAALGRLSAGIAHEVKNPLNATMIHLELLRMQLADAPAALEHLNVIAAQMRRLDEVVQGFLKFTRPEDVHLQPVGIASLVDEILPIINAEAGNHHVEVKVECAPDLPPANADPGLLQQAFLNLALNACQAMPNGGRLRIGAIARQGRLEIVFEDTGIGISADQLSRIFDLYYTTKEHGSGIGLSLVYRTIQLLDGEIEVQSVPGRGTTFRIRLPIAKHRTAIIG